jgi:outer membrane cobalamin receptor
VFGAGGVSNPISGAATQQVSTTSVAYDAGLYWRNTLHWAGSPWTHSPSLRADYFTQTNEFLPVPRLAEKYQIDPSLFLKAATGLYYQAPQAQELAPAIGNPGLQSERAIHATIGFEKDLRHGTDRGYEVSSDVFYKTFDRLVIQSTDPTVNYTNDGTGRAYGLEVQVKYQAKPWTASLVYTLSKSLRTEPGQGEHLFQYDQTHNINFMAAVDLTENLKMSTRFRYVTGDPYTPTTGGDFDSDNDVYTPLRGAFYSDRMTPFFQADVRFDKKWVYQTWILSGYLDIQNFTNQKNVEAIR